MRSGDATRIGIPSRKARAAGAASILVGAAGLAGWAFDAPTLKSVLPGLIDMKANTAVAFVLIGAALAVPRTPARVALALAAALIGAANVVEYAGIDLGIDQLLFRDPAGAARTVHPGRMAEGAAGAFALLGVDVAAFGTPFGRRFNAWFAVPALAVGAVALAGYFYGVEPLQNTAASTPIALNSSVLIVALSVGMLYADPESGLAAWSRGDGPGAVLVRRLLPAAVALPFLLGWLRLRGESAGLFGPTVGVALLVAALAGGGAALVVWSARRIDRLHESRLAAEAEIRERGRILRAVTDATTDGVFVKDVDGRYLFINGAGAGFTGVAPERFIGRSDADLFPESAARASREHDLAGMRAATSHTYEDEFDRGSGARTLLVTKGPLRDESGAVVGVFGIARDITARKKAEAALAVANRRLEERTTQLAEANKELEAFSYSVAHDLRAPLRAVDGFGKALAEDADGRLDAAAKEHLRRIRAAATRMGMLIDDLLALSRVARAEIRSAPLDVTAMANAIAADLRRAEPARDVEFAITEGMSAVGDRELVRLVLENLMGNAWKFTGRKAKARIEVGVSLDADGTQEFRVTDDGAGFDMAYADKLFGAFQRLHAQAEFPGTGVGLASVLRVVRRHGGRVSAQGAPGAGATFRFTLGKEKP